MKSDKASIELLKSKLFIGCLLIMGIYLLTNTIELVVLILWLLMIKIKKL